MDVADSGSPVSLWTKSCVVVNEPPISVDRIPQMWIKSCAVVNQALCRCGTGPGVDVDVSVGVWGGDGVGAVCLRLPTRDGAWLCSSMIDSFTSTARTVEKESIHTSWINPQCLYACLYACPHIYL